MAGYVIDPSTAEPSAIDGEDNLYVPAPGSTYYALTLDGVALTVGYEVFPSWGEANNIAQAYQNGLDNIDNRAWGVETLVAS